jgi:siroheme synthase
LAGGGAGDAGLLTVAGLEAINEADVIVCDRLAPRAALPARPEAAIIDVAKIPRGASTSQEQINQILLDHASAVGDRRGCGICAYWLIGSLSQLRLSMKAPEFL